MSLDKKRASTALESCSTPHTQLLSSVRPRHVKPTRQSALTNLESSYPRVRVNYVNLISSHELLSKQKSKVFSRQTQNFRPLTSLDAVSREKLRSLSPSVVESTLQVPTITSSIKPLVPNFSHHKNRSSIKGSSRAAKHAQSFGTIPVENPYAAQLSDVVMQKVQENLRLLSSIVHRGNTRAQTSTTNDSSQLLDGLRINFVKQGYVPSSTVRRRDIFY